MMTKIKNFDPLKYARTEKPKEATKVKVPANIASTRGPQRKQKFLRRFFKQDEVANKRPTERGETVPRGRIHHCPCGKILSPACLRKGHMVECSKCTQNYKIPGHHCPECDAKEDKKDREDAEALEIEKQRAEKEEGSKWYRDHYKRKKPGIDQGPTEAPLGRVGLMEA